MSQILEGAAQAIDEPLYEVVDGERRKLEPMGAMQTLVAFELGWHISQFVREKKLGVVVTEMLFLLDEESNLQRRPDIAFVSYSRWPENEVDSSAAWKVVPELAVEVVSPTNTADEIDRKLIDYFDAGVQLIWVMHPATGHVYVYDHTRAGRLLQLADTLDGGDVLPGFELKLDTLFAAATRPQ